MATIDGESARIIQAAADIDHALRNSVARRRYLLADAHGKILVDHDWDKPHVSGFPFRISLHQPDIEDAMDARARAQGAEVNQGWEVVSVSQTAEAVTVRARERDTGTERTVKSKYLIGADGARSMVRESLGIEREAWPFRAAWLSFDARRKRPLPNLFGISPDARVAAVFSVPPDRTHSVIPLGVDHVRFNFQIDPDTKHDGSLDRGLAYRRLGEVYGLGEDDVEVYRQAVYPFEGRLAKRWREGRMFLAGDAAHVMTPFKGEGGCSALRDAVNLSWKLDFVLRGLAPDSLLDTYELERKPHVRVHIDGSDALGATVFLGAKAPPPTADPILASGFLQNERRPPVGAPGPQGRVRYHGKEGRFDDLVGRGFQLIVLGPRPELPFLARIGATIASIGDGVVDLDGTYTRFFRSHGIQALLLRPDFIVFGTASSIPAIPALVLELEQALA